MGLEAKTIITGNAKIPSNINHGVILGIIRERHLVGGTNIAGLSEFNERMDVTHLAAAHKIPG